MMQMLVPQMVTTQSMQAMDMDVNAYAYAHEHAPLQHTRRKRKAEFPPENNERLSKRLSLLNLEHSGAKLYVPVENPVGRSSATPARNITTSPISTSTSTPPTTTTTTTFNPTTTPAAAAATTSGFPPAASAPTSNPANNDNDTMQLDDSKYKVYIYNLDDELSSESEAEDGGRLVFLPDIEKHLRKNRILPHGVLSSSGGPGFSSAPGEDVAGRELVLYSIPSSISVPEEKDGVRKAIIEARARAREKQQLVAGTERGDVNMDSGFALSLCASPFSSSPVARAETEQGQAWVDSDAMDLD